VTPPTADDDATAGGSTISEREKSANALRPISNKLPKQGLFLWLFIRRGDASLKTVPDL
jgi:hypothetical protein